MTRPPFLQAETHLLALARTGNRLTHILLVIILSFIFVFAAQIVGTTLVIPLILLISLAAGQFSMDELTNPETSEQFIGMILPNNGLETAIFLIGAFGPIFGILWLWLRFFEQRPFRTLGFERQKMLFQYGRGFAVGLLMFGGAVGLAALPGYIAFELGNPQQQGLSAAGGVLIVLLGWLVQGAAEETLTRGWLLQNVGARYNLWLGILVSAGVFAVLHGLNPNIGSIALLNLFLVGLFTALYALYEGGLWGVCAYHSAWNWVQGNVLGFEVSGNLQPAGTLIDLQEVGPDTITGGAFGPEGGLVVTVVLIIGCVVVLWAGWRQPATATDSPA